MSHKRCAVCLRFRARDQRPVKTTLPSGAVAALCLDCTDDIGMDIAERVVIQKARSN